MASVQRPIKIYARLKPLFSTNAQQYEITPAADHDETEDEFLKMSALKNHDDNHIVNNKPDTFTFRFSKVFDRKTTQDTIFDEVARPVIDSCLLGYNGTIFAYGQTGSGKTFTMTGSRQVYENRGVIPRTLQYIFHKFKEDNDGSKIRAVFVSYLEIYNEGGYDLLHSSSMPGQLEDLVKVTLLEDGNQQMHLRNLSVHPIDSVEEATQLLYLGDHNRTIAETPLNEVSTRSHCIFTIHMNIREANSSTVRRSKLHLVDLAGSERVSNSSMTGQLLTEARHINLALHYLEQVIVALSDSNRQHIPYRNSMMTSVLRDSLGGNCMTSMIATLSMEQRNVQETLSTCRFSQRVAMVTNAAIPNEELDPNLVISQLKSEVKRLKETIGSSLVKPMKENAAALNPEEKADCAALVENYLRDGDPFGILPVMPDMRMIQECFRLLKGAAGLTGSLESRHSTSKSGQKTLGAKKKDNSSLVQTIARRDIEIRVLMDMLRKEKQKKLGETSSSKDKNSSMSIGEMSMTKTIANYLAGVDSDENMTMMSDSAYGFSIEAADKGSESDMTGGELSEVKKTALQAFMENYAGTKELEELRSEVGRKKNDLKILEDTMNKNKVNMDSLRDLMASSENTHDQNALGSALNSQERTYALEVQRLASKREEIVRMSRTLETLYQNLMNDFESWWTGHSKNEQLETKKPLTKVVNAVKRSQVETMPQNSQLPAPQQQSQKGQAPSPAELSSSSPKSTSSPWATQKATTRPVVQPKNIRKDQNGAWIPTEVRPPPRAPPVTPVSPATTRKKFEVFEEEEIRKLPLTGDPEIDTDIIAFFKARKEVFRKMHGEGAAI